MRKRRSWQERAYSFWQRHLWLKVFVIVYVGIAVFVFVYAMVRGERPSRNERTVSATPQVKRITELEAAVRFNGTQFTITNRDAFDWTDVKLEVNGGILSGGYELRQGRMQAGQTYTVGAMQFADSDGVRFNPFQMKPQKFVISADTPGGRAVYVGGWD